MTIPNRTCSPPNPAAKKALPHAAGLKSATAPSKHETHAHHRNDFHGERAARDHARSVEQQPHGGQHAEHPAAVEHHREQRAGQKRRRQADGELAARPAETAECSPLAPCDGWPTRQSPDATEPFDKPSGEPICEAVLPRGDERSREQAVAPITTPPQPGIAVNEAERSIVSRMKRRSSIA